MAADPDDDFMGDDCEDDDSAHEFEMRQREWDGMQRDLRTDGFRDALDEGKERSLQEGFDAGFRGGAGQGRAAGKLLGVIRYVFLSVLDQTIRMMKSYVVHSCLEQHFCQQEQAARSGNAHHVERLADIRGMLEKLFFPERTVAAAERPQIQAIAAACMDLSTGLGPGLEPLAGALRGAAEGCAAVGGE